MSHRQPSVTAVLDDEDCGPRRRTIQQSSGKRRPGKDNTTIAMNRQKIEALQSPSHMEHTFGDQDLSLGHADVKEAAVEF